MSVAEVRETREMAVTKRTALGTGFGVILGLLALSTVLAYHIQESFSKRSVAIHRRYVHEQEVVTSLRRLLYNAGITARDYLLNPTPNKDESYHAQIAELRQTSEPLLNELRKSTTNTAAVRELETNIQELWKALGATSSQGSDNLHNYNFVQKEIAPRRSAAGQILQELENANHSALTATEEDFSASRSAAARNLMWLLASCVFGGLAIAWFSLRYSDNLERQAAARFDEVLEAKLELERLSKRLMEIQEEERTRLSRELHDEIVQNVAVLKIEISQALAGLQNGSATEPLTRARELADRTVRTVRNISLLLRPSLLDDLGLGPALQWQTEDFARRTGVPCEYFEENLQESLPDPVNTCVYRVTQEALRNCEKHSKAGRVSVRVTQAATGLSVEIRDDGVGFTSERRSPASLGVLGMRERAAALGGELRIDSLAGQGTLVRLWLPLTTGGKQLLPMEAHA
jgi:signal transduction histidine kinase